MCAMISKNAPLDQLAGPELTALMQRDDITEIYVNSDGRLWYDSYMDGKVHTDIFLEPAKVLAVIRYVAGQDKKIITKEIPSLSSEIKGYGYRFQGEIPPIVRNPEFNIRKKATRIFTLDDYVKDGMMSLAYKKVIEEAILNRKNILIIGGTGTGKTTFLNAVLAAISQLTPRHRIISLEDMPELQCASEDYSPMFTMQDTENSKIKYDMTQLLADCMRRSPDRIVVGEVRTGAAYTMLKAWNTGHPGGACTVHANGAFEGLSRIESLSLENTDAPRDITVLRMLIGQAIDIAINISHVVKADGKRTRRIDDIIKINGYERKEDKYLLEKVDPEMYLQADEKTGSNTVQNFNGSGLGT